MELPKNSFSQVEEPKETPVAKFSNRIIITRVLQDTDMAIDIFDFKFTSLSLIPAFTNTIMFGSKFPIVFRNITGYSCIKIDNKMPAFGSDDALEYHNIIRIAEGIKYRRIFNNFY